ncbi:hypothetical protein IAT38_003773 [Cryptococcus sp. DSM 104549]
MALRKLQAEIDRTLKSVGQGVEVFESTFDKLNHASNATQKDKLENDLKTQIKKLQRMRDQIKAWLGNGDIKDKTALLDNRRLIETQMERFKALEKEMKMKAFSKEGLIAQSKLDPAEKAKRDMIDWVGTTTDELSRQIEQTEAEAEHLQATRKKKQAGDRLGELEELNDRRSWHIGRLEVVQRMLENGQLSVENVEDIQEDVKYFLEANMEEDFDFDNGIYDELNLQEEEDFMPDFGAHDDTSNHDTASIADPEPTPPPAPAPKTPAKEDKKDKAASTPAKEDKKDEVSAHGSPVVGKKTPTRKSTLESKSAQAAPPLPPVTPAKENAQAGPTPAKPAPLPPIRYAAAAAAAVAGSAPAGAVSASAPQPATQHVAPAPAPAQGAQTAGVLEGVLSPSKEEKRESPGESPKDGAGNGTLPPPPPPGLGARSPQAPSDPTLAHSAQPTPSTAQPQLQPPTQAQQAASPVPNGGIPVAVPPGYGMPQQQQQLGGQGESSRQGAFPGPVPSQPGQPGLQGVQQAGVLGNLMQSFEVAKEMSKRRSDDANELHAALEGSYANIPQQLDAEPPRYYHPKNPIKTPSYYPQSRLPILEDKSIYSRLELDQLFYIFYYMTGTYEQWLAARELKKQSWRFHKQYLTWFQRAHNPQAITGDYEQGGYYYFDWENSWCQRRKSDFRFEYRWLSDH